MSITEFFYVVQWGITGIPPISFVVFLRSISEKVSLWSWTKQLRDRC